MLIYQASPWTPNKLVVVIVSFLWSHAAYSQVNEKPVLKFNRPISSYSQARFFRARRGQLQPSCCLPLRFGEFFFSTPACWSELKRWVAKEATDDGQIIDDQSLTDQAVLDRLDRVQGSGRWPRDCYSATDS